MTNNPSKQEREWILLHDRITAALDGFGKKDPFGNGDYWLVDDNWGTELHQIEFQNLNLLQPSVIKTLQGLLGDFTKWRITVCADIAAPRTTFPPSDLTLYHDYIVDDLPREFLPEQLRNVSYEGAKPAKQINMNDRRSIFRRALSKK
jgi:hypothetical protein